MATVEDIHNEPAVEAETAAVRTRRLLTRLLVYGILIVWAFICLFPIYWTVTTSFKIAPDVMRGNLVPFLDFFPQWLGWRSLGLSPETI